MYEWWYDALVSDKKQQFSHGLNNLICNMQVRLISTEIETRIGKLFTKNVVDW